MNEALGGEDSHNDATNGNAGERDYEAEATKYGWMPEAEFKVKRPDRRAKTAQEFIEDLDRIEERLSPRVQRMLDERTSRLDKAYKAVSQIQERQFQEDLASIRTAQKAAAKEGDDKEFDRLAGEAEALIKTGPDSEANTPPDEAFRKRNDWYGDDEALTAMAQGISQKTMAAYYEKNGKIMPTEEMFEIVEKKVKASAEYKAKFDKPPRRASVDGGSENGDGPAPRGKAKTWSDLPAEAKKAWNGFDPKIKKGLTQEKYAESYWSDN